MIYDETGDDGLGKSDSCYCNMLHGEFKKSSQFFLKNVEIEGLGFNNTIAEIKCVPFINELSPHRLIHWQK